MPLEYARDSPLTLTLTLT